MNERKCINPRKKQKVLERDNFTCVNCGVSGDFNALEVDHIVSVKDGGTNDESNLQTLCYKCNMDKHYGKNVKNKFLLDLSPMERLEVIKDKLKEYKDLTPAEFKVIYTQDETFKKLNLGLLDISCLFNEVREKYGFKAFKIIKNGKEDKSMEQRNDLLYILYKETEKNPYELAELLKKYKFKLSRPQIHKILTEIKKKIQEAAKEKLLLKIYKNK